MFLRDRLTLPLLLLLTLIAGVLRFMAIDRPSVWGDEAQTYGRVAGTYQQLLDQLTDSSFPPLHYELEWWIGQGLPYWGTFEPAADDSGRRTFTPTKFIVPGGIRLTPLALRFIPAVAGTLFVPAIYFLARQLFGPRVALTAAALACFSAYNLVYSRDAKMYMHFWLAVTLHAACGLWWLRTRRALPWALWVLAGVAMVGLHGSGFVMLAIDALLVLTTPRANWRKLGTMAGFVLWPVLLGPVYAAERLRRKYGWGEYTRWDKFKAWPRAAWGRFRLPLIVGFAVGALAMEQAALGSLGFYSAFSQKMQNFAGPERTRVDTGEMGIGWVTEYNFGRKLPDYLLYTTSAYLTGWEWPRRDPVNDQARVAPRTLRLLQGATVMLLALLAVGVTPWRRAFSPTRARLDRITQDGRVTRPFRSRRVLWLAVWLTAIPWVTYTQSQERPANVLDGAAGMLLNTAPNISWPRLRLADDPTLATTEKVKRAVADAKAQWPKQWAAAWPRYTAAWTRANVSTPTIVTLAVIGVVLLVFVFWKWRRVGRGATLLVAVLILLAALGTVVNVLPRKSTGDLWMPRYLGTILPAFWVVVAVLIDRQPRLLRAATLGLFVVVNLTQFSARVWAGSEPPTGLMAADVVNTQPRSIIPTQPERPTTRAYVDFGRFFAGEPGGGTLFTPAGRYYLRMLSGVPGDLLSVRFGAYEQRSLQTYRYVLPAFVERDLNASPWIDRFVVWSGLPFGQVDQTDEIAARLKGRFRRVSEELWPVRDHWRWYEKFQVRRRTYQRIGGPTTRPRA